MDWKEVGAGLAKIGLPLIGAALPIPGGMAIGRLLADQIGPDEKGEMPDTAEKLLDRLSRDAEARAKAAEFEMAHRERMQGMLLDHEHRTALAQDADRADARRRDTAFVSSGRTNVRANWMVALDVFGLLACLAGMMGLGWFKAQHPDAITEGVFGALLAQLSTLASFFGLCLRDAHQFEFGSSRGSREKDDLLALHKQQKAAAD